MQNLAVEAAYVFPNFFDLWKLDSLSVIVNRNAIDLVGISSFSQGGIVELAANIQGHIAGGFKPGITLELEFVGLHLLNYTLVTMARQQLHTLHHCSLSLHYHLVLVTKYRRKVITKKMLERLNEIFSETLQMWDCQLIEFNGEPDHVHLLFEASPVVQLSKLINNLKTVSSRLIRRDFKAEVTRIYWRKPVFWHRSYCIITAGGAPIEMLRRYIEEQARPED